MFRAAVCALPALAAGHAAMVIPKSRNAVDADRREKTRHPPFLDPPSPILGPPIHQRVPHSALIVRTYLADRGSCQGFLGFDDLHELRKESPAIDHAVAAYAHKVRALFM